MSECLSVSNLLMKSSFSEFALCVNFVNAIVFAMDSFSIGKSSVSSLEEVCFRSNPIAKFNVFYSIQRKRYIISIYCIHYFLVW